MMVADPQLDIFRELYKDTAEQKRILSRIERNRLKQGISILLKNVFIIPKVIRNYYRMLAGNLPLRSLEIAVGYECNFSCDQCSCSKNLNPKRKRLTLSQFTNVIDQAIDMGAFQFNLNGGEPQLYLNDILYLCDYIRRKGCYVHMATNGWLLTEERLIKLKNSGLSSFEMGLDSSVESIHDSNRGANGSYKKILEITKVAQKMGFDVSYNTVGTKEKIWNGDLLNTIHLAGNMGVRLMITPPCVTGNWAGRMDLLLNDEEQWYIRWLLSKYPFSRIDNYNGLKGLSCPAAREKMALLPYGDVVSCPLIQIVYGNVLEEKLIAIQNKMLKDHFYFKNLKDGCLPSHDLAFIQERLINERDAPQPDKNLVKRL